MANLEGMRRALGRYFTEPVVTVLEKTHITPNAVTVIGLLITIVAAVLVAFSHPFAGGWVVLFAGLFDMLDGALARRTNNVTKFGGVLDSTLDRVSEGAVLIGMLCCTLINTPPGCRCHWRRDAYFPTGQLHPRQSRIDEYSL